MLKRFFTDGNETRRKEGLAVIEPDDRYALSCLIQWVFRSQIRKGKIHLKIVKEMGMTDMRFHNLRHSYAVAALRSGDDIKAVQENLATTLPPLLWIHMPMQLTR